MNRSSGKHTFKNTLITMRCTGVCVYRMRNRGEGGKIPSFALFAFNFVPDFWLSITIIVGICTLSNSPPTPLSNP